MSTIYGFFGGSHSPSTCLFKDGEIISCIEEERLTRIKAGDNCDIVAELSSVEVEKYTGVKILDADYKIFVEPITEKFARVLTQNNFEVVSHHDSHCYGAYFSSGMDGKVMTISLDGGGDYSYGKVFLCEDGKMNLVHQIPVASSASLATLWGCITCMLKGYDEDGRTIWKMFKDEGKLMGMAPEGKFDEQIYKILKSLISYDNLRFFPNDIHSKTRFVFHNLFLAGYFNTQRKLEILSYNLQLITEEITLKYLDDLHKKYPDYKKLCFSGGLFANVKLNQKINQLDWVDEIYIFPAMGDEGLSFGACVIKAVELGEIKKPFKLKNVFFGKKYSDEQILESSSKFNLQYCDYNPTEIAEFLNEGQIIGWFQHGFEFGPRALGARSILMRPTDYGTHSELNKRLRRHDSMPFAPIVMNEFFDDIFVEKKSKYAAEFMTLCFQTKDDWIEKIPAVIQKSDKTARPQIVKKENNEMFWNILNEYYKISGVPVLLNTSFNTHNEPIIDSPEQSFTKLLDGTLDKLVIGDYVFSNKK